MHLYGQAAQVEVLEKLAAAQGLHLIEDCAQAHFAERMGRRVGTFGVAGTFSFYPGKNLGAYGDAGAIVTNDDELARRCRMYANHGALVKHEHGWRASTAGWTGCRRACSRPSSAHLGAWTRARQQVALWYDTALASADWVTRPRVRSGSTHVYHLYVVQMDERDALRAHLGRHGIETGVHYPVALPLMQAYRYLGMTAADIPNAARNQDRILSLPIYPEMTAEMVEYVVAAIRSFRA